MSHFYGNTSVNCFYSLIEANQSTDNYLVYVCDIPSTLHLGFYDDENFTLHNYAHLLKITRKLLLTHSSIHRCLSTQQKLVKLFDFIRFNAQRHSKVSKNSYSICLNFFSVNCI